jgi:hypothetical protein
MRNGGASAAGPPARASRSNKAWIVRTQRPHFGLTPRQRNTSLARAAEAPQGFVQARTSRSDMTLQEQTIIASQGSIAVGETSGPITHAKAAPRKRFVMT